MDSGARCGRIIGRLQSCQEDRDSGNPVASAHQKLTPRRQFPLITQPLKPLHNKNGCFGKSLDANPDRKIHSWSCWRSNRKRYSRALRPLEGESIPVEIVTSSRSEPSWIKPMTRTESSLEKDLETSYGSRINKLSATIQSPDHTDQQMQYALACLIHQG